MPMDEQTARLLRALSRLLGWIYTISWSASFYPQPISNWKRNSTSGLTVDFPLLNVVGFACYTISTASFLYSPVIRAQYAERHPASPEPTVRFNDMAFGGHALVLVILTYSQFFPGLWGFKIPPRQRASWQVLGIIWASLIAVVTVVLLAAYGSRHDKPPNPHAWAWIDAIYTIGSVKLVATFVKYIPQAWMNYQRKSTKGWSIYQILLDITGGVMSLLQLVIDASLQGDWSGISGNTVKLGLGYISILFDLIFITQHYFLYRYPSSSDEQSINSDSESERPLLTSQ